MATIAILGAGPAGVAAAIGLHRLGYQVELVGRPRRFASVEGVSARVVQALQQCGLTNASEVAANASVRTVTWNQQTNQQNQEWLLDRERFDQALWADAATLGVPVRIAAIESVTANDIGWHIELDEGQSLNADFIVEARGRSAPNSANAARGPETISLVNRWREAPGSRGSETSVHSLADGWVWGARTEDGLCYWQLTLDVMAARLPSKRNLPAYCHSRRRGCPVIASLFSDDLPDQIGVYARSATSTISANMGGANWLRIGDAAMAVDSLSGNGIFQSLSSALQAPAVINTILAKPEFTDLALQFHEQRVTTLFYRFARMGRDFYALETQWQELPFWKSRRAWPDTLPSHHHTTLAKMSIATRPVVHEHFIRPAEVVITPDQPLGMWHVQGLPLAPIVRALQAGEAVADVISGYQLHEQKLLSSWLFSQLNAPVGPTP